MPEIEAKSTLRNYTSGGQWWRRRALVGPIWALMGLDGSCPDLLIPRLRRHPWILLGSSCCTRASGPSVPDLVVVAVFSIGGGRPTVVDLADDGFGRRGIR
jgi:hypothetical protein